MEYATSVGTSLADRAANAVVDGIWQQVRYVLDYNDNMTKLIDNLHDLEHSKVRVDHLADEARRGLEEIEDDVLAWFSRTDEAILRVDRILKDDSMANKTCCAGHLPNFKNRYKLSKRAKLEAPALAELTVKGDKFVRVGYSVPLHRQVLPPRGYEAFESRESTLNSIMGALWSRDADLIGVCGLGGVGKTTLAKEIGQRMKKDGVFKLVVIVEVHPKADLKTIQERVAEWVDIKEDVKSLDSVELRKAKLRKRLLLEERVLVILDDVWDAIDLEEVGIPIGTQCTVLVTTRDTTVVSRMAGGNPKLFHLDIMKDIEAQELFRKKAGAIPEDCHAIADMITKKCGGLPILVLPVATALKGKPSHVWKDALQRLESGLQENEDNMQAKVSSVFQLSFSHLNTDQKSLFMFCGLLKPYYINIEDLVRYTRGLNLFRDCLTITATRNRVRTLLDDLKNYCLLLQDDNREHFKRHDLVHSFARTRHGINLFPPASYLGKWPDTQAFEDLTYISLVDYQPSHLPSGLTCRKLKVLLLYTGYHEQLSSTSNDKFDVAAEELEVLYLSDMTCPSFKDLGKLQTLYADRCVVEDAADIGKLGHLKILSLKDAKIAHLPGEIKRLTGLQLLDLSRCRELKEISPGVLSSFTQLEELLMADSFMQWGIKSPDGLQINADLDELKHLGMLTALEIGVVDVKILPDNLFSDKLERFFIVVGDCWDWSRKKDVSRTLKLKLGANIGELDKVDVLLKKTDDLHLDNSAGVDLSNFDFKGQGLLKHLQLQNFHEIRYLINSDPCIVFPRLESLVIDNARQLEKICIGKMKEKSFSNLKQIKIANCDELKYVFPLSHTKCLSKLEDIDVTYCEKMEGIFAMDESTNMDNQVVHQICIGKLTLEHLPCWNSILSRKLYGPSVIQTTSKDASASSSQDLAFVGEKNIEFRNLRLSSMKIHMIWSSGGPYSSIATLEIEGCKNIKNIFTVSMVNSLSRLKILDIRNCELLTEIVIPANHGGENEIHFPVLEYLRLEKLHSLVTVYTGDLIACHALKELTIDDCPELKTFCTSSQSSHHISLFDDKVRCPELAVLSLSNMDKLIEVWHDKLREDSFRKLKFLWVEKAKNLSKLFSTSMMRRVHTLEELGLLNCDKLQNIFDFRSLGAEKFERTAMLTRIAAIALPSLKHVWVVNPEGIISFENLRQVVVSGCWSLASLIPTSIARQLHSLEEIELMDSYVEQIVSNEDECKDVVTFVFPNLKQMELRDDRRLSSFYLGKHYIDLPKLQNMNIVGCPLRPESFINSKFGNESQIAKQGQQDHPSSSSQPIFSIEERLAKEKVAPIEEERNGSPHRREDDDDDDDVVDSDEMKKPKKKMRM